MAIWSRITGGIAALGIGAAAGDAIDPVLEATKQRAWGERAVKVVEPNTAALAQARDSGNPDTFESLNEAGGTILKSGLPASPVDFADDAKRHGVGSERFKLLRRLNQTVPPYPEALKLWRRGRITEDTVDTILRREAIPEGLRPALKELFEERLNVADVANAIQQNFVPDPPPSHSGNPVLPGTTPPDKEWVHSDGPFTIPRTVVPIDSAREAEAEGINYQRLRVLAELVGLPPGEETLLDMWRRGIIGPGGYAQGLREGHTKTKWTAALSARFYQLLPPSVLVNLRLRGWIEDPAYHERMLLHGYRKEQAQDWYDSSGRPATTHQALVGTRRGGVYDGPLDGIPDYFVKAVRQSNIKPEWTHILYHGRESYPSAFVLRMLTTRGDITGQQAHDLLYQNGWPDWLATAASNAWAGGSTATATDTRVKSAQTSAITEIKNAYLIGQADEAQARDWLGRLGEPGTTQDGLIATWNIMREIPQKGLTAAQIKKAAKSLPTQWPRARALDELQLLGLTADDAATLLDE